jgi:hypothetical protein
MANAGQEADRGLPFLEAWFNIADEGMKMLHQALRDVPQPGILCARHALKHGIGDGVFVKVAHRGFPYHSLFDRAGRPERSA